MRISLERISEEGLFLDEERPPEWWNNFRDFMESGHSGFHEPVKIRVFLTKVGSQIHVRGEIRALVDVECARCLDEITQEVIAPVDVFYVPEKPGVYPEDEDDVGYETYTGESIDLAEHLRGQLALYFPIRFLCKEDCKGLCPSCGANLNYEECHCEVEKFKGPWAVLKNLKF